ncbi:MAG: BrxA/BrxB family bacilliredoxin [Candidatus Krumholzibacteriota bacterium]|nr:BrxA/BrxB family bacilliredoxin [Candidatus Krumholzibacteriota bacterium]
MYPPEIVDPCRQDLTEAGVVELRTANEVDNALKDQEGTALVVINSVCGCAAGNARPGVKLALKHDKLPERVTTVFAGVDQEATERVRSYIAGYPPSSPSIALFKGGQPVYVMERHQIEGRQPQEIAFDLVTAFDEYC